MSPLHPKLREELLSRRRKSWNGGELPAETVLDQYYALFRQRFGPNALASLDGEALLSTMHDHGNRDSLVYWLEFKNDEEFPKIFGSIAGGSALKFGIYRRRETGAWMTGPPQDQQELTVEQAVAVARKHRDQLLAGAGLLDALPDGATDERYLRLQQQMDEAAPDVGDTAWGHKYFSLLFPTKLDDYHVEHYQAFYLTKLLQVPPPGRGRYFMAGRFVGAATELGMSMKYLSSALGSYAGAPYDYWYVRINQSAADRWRDTWASMLANGYLALGWPDLGDLSHVTGSRQSRSEVSALMQQHYPGSSDRAGDAFDFVARMSEGDMVLVVDGERLEGAGRVTSGYQFDESTPAMPHRRQVVWLWQGERELPIKEMDARTVLRARNPENWVFVERLILDADSQPQPPPVTRFDGVIGRVQSILDRKRQVILYGPPGTGKTYWARIAAQNLAATKAYGVPYADLTEAQRQVIMAGTSARGPLVRTCTFHPAYGYEDFLEGYRPENVDGRLVFENRDGIFKSICGDAREDPSCNYYLIIDEINRGDVPRIFGELLMLLEQDKRGQEVLLPLSGEPFSVPPNVYVIGTMNTADRSIALLDTALRRRFGFVELMPDSTLMDDTVIGESIPLGPWLDALNQSILENIGRDARNLQIGHAYLMRNGRPIATLAQLAQVIQDDIVPLLEEYCYEDFDALFKILGAGLVDQQAQRIRHELFEPSRRDTLVEALLAPFPDLSTALRVVEAVAEQSEDEDEELADDGHDDQEQLS